MITLRNRGPVIARSQPRPCCDRKIVNCHFSNPGRRRLIERATAACRRERTVASVNCGHTTLTDILVCKLRRSRGAVQGEPFDDAPAASGLSTLPREWIRVCDFLTIAPAEMGHNRR